MQGFFKSLMALAIALAMAFAATATMAGSGLTAHIDGSGRQGPAIDHTLPATPAPGTSAETPEVVIPVTGLAGRSLAGCDTDLAPSTPVADAVSRSSRRMSLPPPGAPQARNRMRHLAPMAQAPPPGISGSRL